MKKSTNFYFLSFILVFFFAFSVQGAQAAEVYFAPHTGTLYPGDVFVVEARISSPDELINVADGAFLFDKNILEVTEVSIGGSIFSLWAKGPIFSNTDGRVSFVGGAPDGFQSKDGLILKTIFRAKQEGETTLSFGGGFSLLLSDGRGTSISPQTRSLVLHISQRPPQVPLKDEWKALIGADTIPPTFVEAIISKDPQFFDGRYFVSFFATDEGSGVAQYEIKEGDPAFTKAVSPYVLQDQTLGGSIQVKVIDSAGNESLITPQLAPVPHASQYTTMLFWILVVLLIAISAWALFFRLRRKTLNGI